MAIKTDCPRCKTPLLVPNESAGTYAHCPQCKGRLWVAKDAPADAMAVAAIEVLSAPGRLPIRGAGGATLPQPAPAETGPPARKAKKSSSLRAVPPAAPRRRSRRSPA